MVITVPGTKHIPVRVEPDFPQNPLGDFLRRFG